MEAIEQLYADDIVSVEAVAMENMPRTMEGKEAIKGKHTWWVENNELHDAEVKGPFPHGEDRFTVYYRFDITSKPAGQRTQMHEVALYTLKDGKIAREEFFYHTG
jgi:ketosteroid isomerase-like protein